MGVACLKFQGENLQVAIKINREIRTSRFSPSKVSHYTVHHPNIVSYV